MRGLIPFEYPRIIHLEDDFSDLYSDIIDMISPFSTPRIGYYDLFRPSARSRRKSDDRVYTISIGVGNHYQPKDITTSIEGCKLIVKGHSLESLKNGNNVHSFQREYELPENVIIESLKTKLSGDGTFYVTFDRKVTVPKPDFENLSTDNELRFKISLPGFKPDQINARTVGRSLIIEGGTKSQTTSEDNSSQTSSSAYASRVLHLGDEVDIEKLRAVRSGDSIEIIAPRNPALLTPQEKKLEIEQ